MLAGLMLCYFTFDIDRIIDSRIIKRENYESLYFIDKDGFADNRQDADGTPRLTKYKTILDF